MSEEIIAPVSNVSHRFKVVAELLTVLAIAGYAVGFIIVNSYLFTFGYSGHALFKTTYISAGMLFLYLVVPLALCIGAIILNGQKAAAIPQVQVSHFFSATSFIVLLLMYIPHMTLRFIGSDGLRSPAEEEIWLKSVIVGVVGVITLTIIVLENIKREWRPALWAKKYPNLGLLLLFVLVYMLDFKGEVVLFLVMVGAAIFLAIVVLLDKEPLLIRVLTKPHEVARDLSLTIGMFLFAMGLFGVSVYPSIKPQYGGGQPSRVRVLIGEEKMNALIRGSGLKNLESMLGDTQLIDSTEKELLLLLKSTYGDKGILLQVDRTIVDAVMYLHSSSSVKQ
jgi:hypothetical protein